MMKSLSIATLVLVYKKHFFYCYSEFITRVTLNKTSTVLSVYNSLEELFFLKKKRIHTCQLTTFA